ncbi:B2 protein [Carex littledalei]|uniref:B2 protein n=1 Tax=Carex littledalei TaxID=544730 RepID=A0A833R5M9_9POAL|nr:B2 protein [Carex littledalei]
MPPMHNLYVRNIQAGLPLFLFNYSDRQLHGIFEAAGPGQMNIDLYAWSNNKSVKTPYPAQIRICTKIQCLPLHEAQFKKAIADNYFTAVRFYFELDHAQTRHLISLFGPIYPGHAPYSVAVSPSTARNLQHNILSKQIPDYRNLSNSASAALTLVPNNWIECSKASTSSREVKEKWKVQGTWADRVVWDKMKSNNTESEGVSSQSQFSDAIHQQDFQSNQFGISSESGFNEHTVLNYLRALTMDKEEQMGCASGNFESRLPPEAKLEVQVPGEAIDTGRLQLAQSYMNDDLMQILKELDVQKTELQKKQDDSVREIEWLYEIVNQSEIKTVQLESWLDELALRLDLSEKLIYLIGGFDSLDWLSSFDAFSPSKDMLMPLKRMSSARAYTSVAILEEFIFVLGGSDGNMWSDTGI